MHMTAHDHPHPAPGLLRKRRLRVCGVFLLVAGLAAGAASVHQLWWGYRMSASGLPARGAVCRQYLDQPGNGRSPRHVLRVRFQDTGGQSREVDEYVTEAYWQQHPEGAKVDVRYLPDDPDKAELVDQPYGGAHWWQIAFGVIAMAAGLALLYLPTRRARPPSGS